MTIFYDRKNKIDILQENERQAHDSAVFTVRTGRHRVGKIQSLLHSPQKTLYQTSLQNFS